MMLADATIDQFLIMYLSSSAFGTGDTTKISADEARSRGLIEPGPTGTKMALAEAKRLEDEARKAKRAERRRRKREQAPAEQTAGA